MNAATRYQLQAEARRCGFDEPEPVFALHALAEWRAPKVTGSRVNRLLLSHRAPGRWAEHWCLLLTGTLTLSS